MQFIANSDVGRKRNNNEDTYYINKLDENNILFIVADGLGGYESGEIASGMLATDVSNYINSNFKSLLSMSKDEVKKFISRIVDICNKKIYNLQKSDEKYKGMGTTVVLLLYLNNIMYYLSIGDSRMYYIDENCSSISQVTQDDTYVNELLKTNAITLEEAKVHPRKHVLTKAVGVFDKLQVNVEILDKNKGYLVMCSDGITNMLEDSEILNIVKTTEFNQAVNKMIQKANENGGVDNITAIVIKL